MSALCESDNCKQSLHRIGDKDGVHVCFSHGFGTNVHIRNARYGELVMSIVGWRELCRLVDSYRSLEETGILSNWSNAQDES